MRIKSPRTAFTTAISLLFTSSPFRHFLACRAYATSSEMIKVIPNAKLGMSEPNPSWFGNPSNSKDDPRWTNANWLKSRFHFSFAEYSNPHNLNFGVLRVMNDDLVQPDRGFGAHPHRDVEICTYVVEGSLTHKDSMGTSESLGRGAIQFMTAGSGVTHSEHNLDKENPLRFIQIWINTRKRGLPPNYGSNAGNADARRNNWHHVVGDVRSHEEVGIKINQDANIFVTEVDSGKRATTVLQEGRQAYLLCIEGSAEINGAKVLNRHDAAELTGPMDLDIAPADSSEGAHCLLVEMAYSGDGRMDL